jgi:DNA-binding transcriptional regulator YhcF (GntR family)
VSNIVYSETAFGCSHISPAWRANSPDGNQWSAGSWRRAAINTRAGRQIRELAVRYAINPMTVSKIYSILEAEGVLERNRGKPMTVAAGQSPKEPVGSRLRQLEPHLENLALAAKQLNLGERDVTRALRKKLEK